MSHESGVVKAGSRCYVLRATLRLTSDTGSDATDGLTTEN